MQLPNTYPSVATRTPAGKVNASSAAASRALYQPMSTLLRSAFLTERKPSPAAKVTLIEPEDAHITGTTRSLSRRLLALNIRQAV